MKIVKITDKEYFRSDGLNASALKEFAKSPAHYKAYIDQPFKKESDIFRIGTQAHKYILERKNLNIMPKCDRRKKEGKEIFAKFQASLPYSTDYVNDAEMEAIQAMRDRVDTHPYAAMITEPDWAEKAAFVKCPQTGLDLKCKYDCLPDRGNCIYDLKTTEDASPEKFRWSIKNFRYDIQACHYLYIAQLLGLHKPHFIFVAVEKKAPYGVSTIAIDANSLHYAQQQYFELLNKFAQCQREDNFSECYRTDIVTVTI